jgi:hypothetical protein
MSRGQPEGAPVAGKALKKANLAGDYVYLHHQNYPGRRIRTGREQEQGWLLHL